MMAASRVIDPGGFPWTAGAGFSQSHAVRPHRRLWGRRKNHKSPSAADRVHGRATRKKKARALVVPGLLSVLLRWQPEDPRAFCRCRAAMSSRVNRRNRTRGSCYSSPHVQSELVTDHLHFAERAGPYTGPVSLGTCQAVAGEIRG